MKQFHNNLDKSCLESLALVKITENNTLQFPENRYLTSFSHETLLFCDFFCYHTHVVRGSDAGTAINYDQRMEVES